MKHKIASMSNEHTTWLSALDFYKQDLSTLRNRLTEIAGKYTDKAISGEIEHFENQFKVQSVNIDILHHNINENLSATAVQVQNNTAGYIDDELLKKHAMHQEMFAGLEKTINDLRHDFNHFASKWM